MKSVEKRMYRDWKKGVCLFVLMFVLLGVGKAQDGGVVSFLKKSLEELGVTKRSFEGSWAELEFDYLDFVYFMSEYSEPYRLSGGWRFGWNVFDVEIPFSYRCGLVMELGYESNVYYGQNPQLFTAQMFRERGVDNVSIGLFEGGEASKLVARYITVPLFDNRVHDNIIPNSIGLNLKL